MTGINCDETVNSDNVQNFKKFCQKREFKGRGPVSVELLPHTIQMGNYTNTHSANREEESKYHACFFKGSGNRVNA